MNNKTFNLDFGTTFTDIKDINHNFAIGKMRIAYAGRNRNMTDISKEVFEEAIPTMFNCPVVVRYDREKNMFGGHDIEVVVSDNAIKVVNATTPIGIVPAGAQWCWETVTEADGQVRAYLCVEVLFWKRQEAYAHLLELGSADQSMEVEFLDYHEDNDGYYVADKICFSAFCLLEAVEPCFESAAVELFAFKREDEYKRQFALMLDDLREYTEEKGDEQVEEQEKTLVVEEELEVEAEEESAEPEVEEKEFSVVTYRQKFEALAKALPSKVIRDEESDEIIGAEDYWLSDFDDAYMLVEQRIWSREESEKCNFGRFAYTFDEKEVKAEIIGDFERMVVTWLTEAENEALMQERESANQTEQDFAEYKETHSYEDCEVESLREFKAQVEAEARNVAVQSVFDSFEDLADNEEFKQFAASNIDSMEIEEIQNRCFAIRGKSVEVNNKPIKLPAITGYAHDEEGKLYGGLFEKFGYKKD